MIVLEARSSRVGAALYFVVELLPRVEKILRERGQQVEIVAGPPADIGERWRRRKLYRRATAIFHTGNRATLSRARKVVIMQDRLLFPVEEEVPRSSLRHRVRRALAVHALMVGDVIVVPSRAMVGPIEQVRGRLAFLPKTPVEVVPHGRPGWDPPAERPLHDPMRLLLPGLTSWQKNIPFMAGVLAANRRMGGPAVHFTVTATGDEVVEGRRLRDAFVEVDDLVSFIGPQPRDRLASLYSDHDVVVFPSLVESFGHPPLEAMSMGMPVVVSDRSWAREICADGALYADPKDPGAWVGALRRIHDGGVRANPAGRSRALAFDWDRAARAYADLLVAGV